MTSDARLRRWLRPTKVLGAFVLVPIAIFIVGAFAFQWIWEANFFGDYQPALPLNVTIVEKTERRTGDTREVLTYQAKPGLMTDAIFHYPSAREAPVPCIVALLWHQARLKDFERAAGPYVDAGFAIVTTEGLGFRDTGKRAEHRGLRRHVNRLNAGRNAVVEARRILDYLQTRPEIDSNRIYLMGISLGTMAAIPALVEEQRYRAGIMMWGAGDLPRLLDSYAVYGRLSFSEHWFLRLAIWLLEPIEPLRWIDRIAPRPVLFQNARVDELLPAETVAALHKRAREPKTILWYDSVHEGQVDESEIKRAIYDQIAWLRDLEQR